MYGVLSRDVTAAILVSPTNPPGIEVYYHANVFFCFSGTKKGYWSREWKHSIVTTWFFFVTMHVRACKILVETGQNERKKSTFNMRTKEMLGDVGSNVWRAVSTFSTSSNHPTLWMVIKHGGKTLKCWFTQHIWSSNYYRFAGPFKWATKRS